jgi:hypothetical protein
MTGLIALAYLFVVAYWIPRQVYKCLPVSSKWVRAAAFAATSVLLTLGPFLPDAYVIRATQLACEGRPPYRVGSAKPNNLVLVSEDVNRGLYTERILKRIDKDSGALAHESYTFHPNTDGPFAWLLKDNFKGLHPFYKEVSCPFNRSVHSKDMYNEYQEKSKL